MPPIDPIPLLSLTLAEGGSVVLLTAGQEVSFASPLIEFLKRKGEKLFVVDLREMREPPFDDPAFLTSSAFVHQIRALKDNYDRILIVTTGPAACYQTQALIRVADSIVYGISGESLMEVHSLPEKTIFLIQPHEQRPFLSLKEITPRLEQLLQTKKLSSFSSAQNAWDALFPSKRS